MLEMYRPPVHPFLIKFSIIGLQAFLLLNVYGMYMYGSYRNILGSGLLNISVFVLGVAMSILIVATTSRIHVRSKSARVMGIVTFGLLSFFSVETALSLFWLSETQTVFLFTKILAAVRIIASLALLLLFIFSKTVKDYFPAPVEEETISSPPPPPIFND
jgi:hypothetical protein